MAYEWICVSHLHRERTAKWGSYFCSNKLWYKLAFLGFTIPDNLWKHSVQNCFTQCMNVLSAFRIIWRFFSNEKESSMVLSLVEWHRLLVRISYVYKYRDNQVICKVSRFLFLNTLHAARSKCIKNMDMWSKNVWHNKNDIKSEINSTYIWNWI